MIISDKWPNGTPITPTQVAEWLRLFRRPGEVVELRAIGVTEGRWSSTHTGFYDYNHLDEMAKAAIQLSTKAEGVYFTLNAVHPDLLHRCCNRVQAAKKNEQVGDSHILRRSWLLIDIDPVRLPGISSTDVEKTAALQLAYEVRDYLRHEASWLDPILADSGNGYHLLYPVNLPTDDSGLVEKCLKALSQRFDTEQVTIDTTVFNPSRITKLYGTLARKGDASLVRPHRPSMILEVPSPTGSADYIITAGHLEALAEEFVTPAVPIADILKLPSTDGAAWNYVDKIERSVSGQKGHNQLWRAARVLILTFNLPDSEALRILSHWNEGCSPPWSENELQHKIEQVHKNARNAPQRREQGNAHGRPKFRCAGVSPKAQGRTILPYRPFPVHALPSPLREYVTEAAKALGCDPAYVALPCLAVTAGLIGYTRVLQPKRGWRVPSVLWTLVVADSGSLKTPAWRQAADFLFELQKRLDNEFKRDLAAYAKAKEEWEAAVALAKKNNAKPPGDKPEPPIHHTVFTSNATIEALAELIEDNPRGIVVSCDELASWLNSFTRYKGKAGGTDLPHWLSMHSAAGFAYHRKTGDRRRIVVSHAAVSIAGGIQPGILARAIAGDFMDSGGFARILPAMPPRPAKVWTELEIDPETEKRYYDLLDALFALPFDERNGKDVPHVLRLSAEAKVIWVDWYNAWGREQAAVEGELAAAFSKIEEAAARLALVHHCVSRVERGDSDLCPVETESVAAGVELARWFAREAERVYAVLAEPMEQRDTRRLVEYVRGRGGCISVRELQRANGRRYPDAATAEAALESLVQTGLAQWIPADHGRVAKLCPTPDTSDRPDADSPTNPPPLSDTASDSSTPILHKHGQNGQVSDMSDCRIDTPTPAADSKANTPDAGENPKVSDGSDFGGPYHEGF